MLIHALRYRAAVVGALALLTATAALSQATPDNRQVRRLQLQMQALQQQLQEAQTAKGKVEADKAVDKAAAEKSTAEQAKQAGSLKGQLRKTGDELKAAAAERARLAGQVAALERQLAEQKRGGDETLAQKARELTQFTKLRDDQQAQLQRAHDEQVVQVGECTAKNGRLIQLSAELLDRYRNKSVADVVKQREPLLGLGDVSLFNQVQDYRDRADAERFVPAAKR